MKYQNFSFLVLFTFFLCSDGFTMMRALNTAASGMATQEAFVNTITQNISNANTIGYKRQRAEAEDLLYQTIIEPGAKSDTNSLHNAGLQFGSGSRVVAVTREFSEGTPMMTQQPYDLMIQGQGFFGINMPDGTIRYTRDGSFRVSFQGLLVTKKGYPVYPNIQLPPNLVSIVINAKGDVEAYIKNQKEPVQAGTIPIFTFVNTNGLRAMGENLYSDTTSSGTPIQLIAGTENAGSILQGALESSNINPVAEMSNLIKAQRAYEMNSKVMTTADQMLQTLNNLR